ncbi:MAG: ABC-F family ATP-binding cassette domain-containing protein [Nannocystaceae bacterium]
MSLVVFEHVSLGFGDKSIVDDLNLRIGDGERIGLVGPNGSGKSSLLRMIAGDQGVDAGTIRFARGVRVGYLAQDIAPVEGIGLLDYIVSSVPGRAQLDADVAAVEEELLQAQVAGESGDGVDAEAVMELATRLAELHEEIQHFETHYTPHEAERILAGLGFRAEDSGRDLGEFSGGWRMRAVLAGLLFQRPDLLLLDEPTNHLDLPSVAWFASFLRRYRRSFILVCHDREFLNEQIDRVVSFEPEGVRFYSGDFESYRKQRAEEATILENKARNLQREREQAERFIERFRSKASKAKAVQSRIKALERMGDVETLASRDVMSFRFPPCARAGDVVAKIDGLRKAYDANVVLGGVDLTVRRGEKIGIIGVNGAGKTTLLKLIAGEIKSDGGAIQMGNKVDVGYFAQHHAEMLSRERTVFEEVASVDPSAGQTRVRSVLGAFLFSGDDVDKPIPVLSGGERARVALSKLLLRPGNFLLLDEPTNHLDLESSESLAEALSSFDGTLLFVSHNRAFVRSLATRIWDVHDGEVEIYPGTLDEYMDHHRRRREGEEAAAGEAAASEPRGAPGAPSGAASKRDDRGASKGREAAKETQESRESAKERRRREADERRLRQKRLGPLQRKVAKMEGQIAGLEDSQRERSALLADPAVYGDEARRSELLDAYQRDARVVEALTGEWEIALAELEDLEAALDAEISG